jgi:hypothetical protein
MLNALKWAEGRCGEVLIGVVYILSQCSMHRPEVALVLKAVGAGQVLASLLSSTEDDDAALGIAQLMKLLDASVKPSAAAGASAASSAATAQRSAQLQRAAQAHVVAASARCAARQAAGPAQAAAGCGQGGADSSVYIARISPAVPQPLALAAHVVPCARSALHGPMDRQWRDLRA